MNEEQRVARGRQARTILDDPLVEEVFLKLEEDAVLEWKRATDPQIREKAWFALQYLELFKTKLRSVRDDGDWTTEMAERAEQRKEK